MSATRSLRASGWALTFLILAAIPEAQAGKDDEVVSQAIPEIRRIFVPAANPERWPRGNWQEMRIGQFEQIEEQWNALRATAPGTGSTPLEKAEYRAVFAGDNLQQGRLEWTPCATAAANDFLPLGPFNLAVNQLEWVRSGNSNPARPVVWGTAPSKDVGLLRDADGQVVAGNWTLRGRRLIRSTDFELRLPQAIVSHLTLVVPEGLLVTCTAGDLAGPKPATETGWSLWDLHLGSRSDCRLRISPPVSDTARRPLILSRTRTNYVVRPEVVRLVAEFDLEVYEAAATELRLVLDAGLQVTAVEYGDESDVEWRIPDGTDGREIVVVLPNALTGPGQTLRVRGIAPLKPREPWSVPRIRLKEAAESEPQVKVRLQPPYQAADLQIDGYRQVELTSSATDGETMLLRQLRRDASLTIVPARQALSGIGRSVTLVTLDGDEWALTSYLSLEATSGEAFDVTCDVPPEWDITSVHGESDSGPSDLSGWVVESIAGKSSRLHLSFLTALSTNRPQRVRITARRKGVPTGETLPVIALACRDLTDLEAVTVMVGGEKRQPVVEWLSGFEALNLADLPANVQNLEILKALSAAARAAAVVIRTDVAEATGAVILRPLHGSEDPPSGKRNREQDKHAEVTATGHVPIEPVVVLSVHVDVKLSEADLGFDLYQVTAVLRGPSGAEISWRLPMIAEPIGVRLNGHSAAPEMIAGRQTLLLANAGSKADGGHVLSLEYRTPVRRGFGPQLQQLAVPEFTSAVMSSRLQLLVPKTLRIVDQSGGLVRVTGKDEFDGLLGPLGRTLSAPFNPFHAADWNQLLAVFTTAPDESSPGTLSLPATDELHPQETPDGADFDILRGDSLAPFTGVELTLWNRREAQSLAWTTFLTSILGTVCLRIRRSLRGRLLAALIAAGLTGVLCVFPRFPGELAGAMLAGFAIGILLPARFCELPRPATIVDPASIPSGSTRVFVVSSAILFSSVLMCHYAVRAEESRSATGGDTRHEDAPSPDRLDVLIPTTGQHAHEADSICYVPADFRARVNRLLSARQGPRYLLNSVAIDAKVTDGGQTDVTAKFKVYVLSSDAPVTVVLPITNAVLGGPDACLVDGRPHPILLGSEGRTLTIQLFGKSDRPAPVPEPDAAGPDSQPVGTIFPGSKPADRPRPIAYEIQLQLHLATELEANDSFRSRLGIPRANDTSAEFSTGGGLVPLLTFETDDGLRQVISAENSAPPRIAGATGPTGQLEFRWSRNAQGVQALPVELDASVAAMVDVSPSLASAAYRVGYRVLSGSVDSLVWKLPRGCTLQSVHSPDLSGYVLEQGDDESRLLFLEFSTPQSGNIAVTATLILPFPSDARECEFPMLELEGAPGQAGHTILRRYQIAFRPPVDFQLDVAAASNLVIKPRNVDEFLKDWPVVGARPQQALELIRPGTLRFKFRDLDAELTAKTEFHGRFTSSRLEWNYRAEITPLAVPPFQYRLEIDPRLRIRSVSVQEDGAERLMRWTHVDNSLILYLNDRATRTQTLRVSGLMPLATPEEFALPQLALGGARSGSHRVTLRSEPDVRVTVLGDAAGRKPLGPPPEAPEQNRTDRVIARFDVPAEVALPRVRVEPEPAIASAVSAYLLRPSGTGQELTVAIQFRVHSGRIRQFELQLPNELAQRARIETIPPSQPLQLPDCDGRSQRAFVPAHPVSERFYIVIRAPVELPADADWIVPEITSSLFEVSDEFLLVGGDELAELQTIDPPDWLHGLFENEPDFAQLACYRLPAGNSAIHLKSSPADLVPDSLSDARVELETGGLMRGQLRLWLPDHIGSELVMDWPAGCQPLAVFVDDRPRQVPTPDGETWTLPLPSAAAPRLVWLAWKDPSAAAPYVAGRWQPRIPAPRNIAVKTELLTIRTDPRLIVRPRNAESPEEPLHAALARWQAILSATGRRSSSEEPWLTRTLAEAARDAEFFARSSPAIPLPLQKQLDGLRRQSERLKLPKGADTPAASAMAQSLAGFDSNRADTTSGLTGQTWTQTRSSDAPADASGSDEWLINRRAAHLLLGILAALAAGLIVWSGAGVWCWVQRSEPVAWAALGAFWWLALRPSALGLIVLAFGVVRFWQIRRSRMIASTAPPASA